MVLDAHRSAGKVKEDKKKKKWIRTGPNSTISSILYALLDWTSKNLMIKRPLNIEAVNLTPKMT